MKTLSILPALLAAALLAGSAAARAEPPSDTDRQARIERCKADPDTCREQARQRGEERFRQADTDGDGAISRAEAQAGMPRLAKHFDELDANGDGKITLEEMRAAGDRMRAQRQACKDDPQACQADLQKRADEHFRKLDADGDGTISRAEAEKGAPRMAEHFDELDANGDSRLTPDELKAAHQRRQAQRRAPGGES
jgi:Ca2+-binding EF-hand superfamily protein